MQGKVMALVPAAGVGRRMAADQPKQFLSLGGMPLLSRTLSVLDAVREIWGVVVAAPPGLVDEVYEAYLRPYGIAKVKAVVPGGRERQDSVKNALQAAQEQGAEWVLVHDAVRPLAGPGLFREVLAAAQKHGAAAAALPCSDTVKEAHADGRVIATLDRSRLWLVQTPQGFSAPLLEQALARASAEGYYATDEAALLEWMGEEVRLVKGARENLKITTPADLRLAQGWLNAGGAGLRVGQGMDAHRLVPDRPLILGGVRIEFAMGLLGHSDADVLTHAVMDALLAAAGLGDIGHIFPDTDPQYKYASSLDLLEKVRERLAAEGWQPRQVSATLIAQRPKVAGFTPAMRENLAQRLGLDTSAVNIAATTTEGLGFTGREEGMAAMATALVIPRPMESIS